jgi:hypothetical protein
MPLESRLAALKSRMQVTMPADCLDQPEFALTPALGQPALRSRIVPRQTAPRFILADHHE